MKPELLELLIYLALWVFGVGCAYAVMRGHKQSGYAQGFEVGQASQNSQIAVLNERLEQQSEQLAQVKLALKETQTRYEQVQSALAQRQNELSTLEKEYELQQQNAQEKLALLEQAKQSLSDQFKSLANDILEEKAKRFTEQNQTNIGQILDPLRERIMEFKSRVEEIHTHDTQQQATLKAELARLSELNKQMTQEAHSLTVAFKGQSKKQGNWGELVLANVLDRSGLRADVDFMTEKSFTNEAGKRQRPDVIVHLPQNKQLIIDAKVSLNAYTRYVNEEDDLLRQQALKEHVRAIGDRIAELSDRAYFELPSMNTPEMVFMFIPVESAFVEAIKADETLFQKALEKNVLVCTPTTLLTSLNIVRQLWRFEAQNKHTALLADSASKVHKKLVTFLGSLEDIGKKLDSAKSSYDQALSQLYSGKNSLITQANNFKNLGVSVQSQLPEKLVEKASLELEYVPVQADLTVDSTRDQVSDER